MSCFDVIISTFMANSANHTYIPLNMPLKEFCADEETSKGCYKLEHIFFCLLILGVCYDASSVIHSR